MNDSVSTTSEPQEIIDRFRSRAAGLRRKRDQAHADIRRTLERIAPAHVDIRANYQDPAYDEWIAEAEMLEADADTIERLATALREKETERSRAAIKALQGDLAVSLLKPMFRWVHGRVYFDGHEFSEQHGLVVLNEAGKEVLRSLADNPLWRSS